MIRMIRQIPMKVLKEAAERCDSVQPKAGSSDPVKDGAARPN
jgi:hypothetical protein